MAGKVLKITVFALICLIVAACSADKAESDPETRIVREFFEARVSGNADAAYGMLSESTKRLYSDAQFKEYCFIYKVVEFETSAGKDGYIPVKYTFYDKKYKKESTELYTYYITDNIENLRVENGKILFPHVGFIALRQAIEARDTGKAEAAVKSMRDLDPGNPDVRDTIDKMGFNVR